jgi:type II secretory pathway pseudopilin PulG
MTILAILAGVAVIAFGKFQGRGEEQEVRALIEQVSEGFIDGHYLLDKGDSPPDDYTGLPAKPTNDLNTGDESMLASLAAPAAPWPLPDEKHLGNTDEDLFPKKVTTYATLDAFEIVDRWGNPLAYFHCKSYGRKQKVRAKSRESGVFEEQEVQAVRNSKTQQFFKPESYQLISAGRDGVFGTADDLANFEMPAR